MAISKCMVVTSAAVVVLLGFVSAADAGEQESVTDRIERATQAAPAAIPDEATVVDVDGTVLRKGSNGWTCCRE